MLFFFDVLSPGTVGCSASAEAAGAFVVLLSVVDEDDNLLGAVGDAEDGGSPPPSALALRDAAAVLYRRNCLDNVSSADGTAADEYQDQDDADAADENQDDDDASDEDEVEVEVEVEVEIEVDDEDEETEPDEEEDDNLEALSRLHSSLWPSRHAARWQAWEQYFRCMHREQKRSRWVLVGAAAMPQLSHVAVLMKTAGSWSNWVH